MNKDQFLDIISWFAFIAALFVFFTARLAVGGQIECDNKIFDRDGNNYETFTVRTNNANEQKQMHQRLITHSVFHGPAQYDCFALDKNGNRIINKKDNE